MSQPHIQQEQQAAMAFSKQSAVFDAQYSNDAIIQYKRARVRAVLQPFVQGGVRVLELNSGTGEDAIWLAAQGCTVNATDIATGMQDQLRQKAAAAGFGDRVFAEYCSYTRLDTLQDKGPYQLIFSNFAGLNCTGELYKVLSQFDRLLAPGGSAVLVVMPGFCLWESLLVLKGKFRTATRRWFSRRGVPAKVEGLPFTCWYYAPRYIKRCVQDKFAVAGLEGLCTIVPPSYISFFAERHPRLYGWLVKQENRLCKSWPWKYWGDYYIITLKKKTNGITG